MVGGIGCKLLRPVEPAGSLHNDKQSNDRSDSDCQAGKAFKEEGVGEQHKIDKLSGAGLQGCEAHSHYQPQIAHHQEDRDKGAQGECHMDRNVIDQVSKQQMEGKECAGEKEVIHRMQLDIARGRNDEHQEEEEKERDGREETDLSGERSRLQLLRHDHRNLKTRDKVLV